MWASSDASFGLKGIAGSGLGFSGSPWGGSECWHFALGVGSPFVGLPTPHRGTAWAYPSLVMNKKEAAVSVNEHKRTRFFVTVKSLFSGFID